MNHPVEIDHHLLNWHSAGAEMWASCLEKTGLYAKHVTVGRHQLAGVGKQIGLVFFNDSLRTRTSMELAAHQLGAYPVVITPGHGTWGFAWNHNEPMIGAAAEHIREAIGVLSRYVDVLGVRLFASGTDLEEDRNEMLFKIILEAATVPVVNLESAFWHPCQALADAAVLKQHFDCETAGKKFVLSWAPHPKALPTAVPNSTLLMAARMGMNVTVARPDGFDLDDSVMNEAFVQSVANGGSLAVTDAQECAFDGADVVYAKSWGGLVRYHDQKHEAALRAAASDWTVSEEKMSLTADAAFMHCLPVRRGVVVENTVLDGTESLHLDQAEYRLHAQKAILDWYWKEEDRR